MHGLYRCDQISCPFKWGRKVGERRSPQWTCGIKKFLYDNVHGEQLSSIILLRSHNLINYQPQAVRNLG
jgi:hypothetical protein